MDEFFSFGAPNHRFEKSVSNQKRNNWVENLNFFILSAIGSTNLFLFRFPPTGHVIRLGYRSVMVLIFILLILIMGKGKKRNREKAGPRVEPVRFMVSDTDESDAGDNP